MYSGNFISSYFFLRLFFWLRRTNLTLYKRITPYCSLINSVVLLHGWASFINAAVDFITCIHTFMLLSESLTDSCKAFHTRRAFRTLCITSVQCSSTGRSSPAKIHQGMYAESCDSFICKPRGVGHRLGRLKLILNERLAVLEGFDAWSAPLGVSFPLP